MDATKAKAMIELVQAIADTIRNAKQIPSGHLYAMMMEYGCTLETYRYLLGILVESGRVACRGNVLVWQDTVK